MKIVVLNGSPKGEPSVTMQYVKFIQKHYPGHEYLFHNISSQIKKIEKDEGLFSAIMADIESCDSIIWSTPVYTLFVPAQYMRFIELIHERNVAQAFKNKAAIVMTTSIHFYDHTAHRYMHAVCDDLEMNYIGYFSAEMDDLRKARGRQTLLKFAKNYFESSEQRFHHQKRYQPITPIKDAFEPALVSKKLDAHNKKIVLVTDHKPHDTGIQAMIKRFSDAYTDNIDIINLWDINIQGGCTGCIKCGYDNSCMYKDDFSAFYRSRILPADIVIFAMALTDRNISSKFKEYFDRRFFMNHVPDLKDKQVGFLVSGRMSQMPYLHDFYQGSVEWQQANFAGIVCDETGDSNEIDTSIQNLAEQVITFSDKAYCQPQTFLGVGGRKIFRDDIWGKLRYVFQADYRYYKKNGAFNFPHRRYKSRLTNSVVMLLTRIPGFRKEFYSRIKTEMYKPHKHIVENCDARSS